MSTNSKAKALHDATTVSTRAVDPRDPQGGRTSATPVYQQRSAEITPSDTAAPAMLAKRKYNGHSRISIPTRKAKMLLDDTVVSTRATYPQSEARKHIWHSRTSMAISRVKAHLSQRAMICVCPHRGIVNRQGENTTNPVVY